MLNLSRTCRQYYFLMIVNLIGIMMIYLDLNFYPYNFKVHFNAVMPLVSELFLDVDPAMHS
ncbi:hypothetical protein ED28_01270 [[Pantoea] beijingensis]|uniref:Uncharacterized protein n=1 Tax=[Pantoea] beijingensis TaxID=1324864 RepID=A0A443II03_9GAMM|nr:hypothetical protein ED28_01270 [[Pantoea] beijingensis]